MKNKFAPFVNVILGGIFFLVPLFLIIAISVKALTIFRPFGKKLADKLDLQGPFAVFFIDLSCFIILMLICYLAGYLLKKGLLKEWSGNVEEKIFYLFPGLQRLKFSLLGEEQIKQKQIWQPILFREDDTYRIGAITFNDDPDFVSVFIPDIPRMDAGELRYFKRKSFEYYPIEFKTMADTISQYGRGINISEIIKDNKGANPSVS